MFSRKLRRTLQVEALETRNLLTLSVGLSTMNELFVFNTNAPETVYGPYPITGLAAGETMLGIDYRPADFQLYGVSNANRLYRLNPETGAATGIGGPFSTPLDGSKIAIDFNPTVDRLRIVTDSGQNLRVNPDTGAIVAVDMPLAYGGHDPFFGSPPTVAAAAYTNNFAGSTETNLYVLDTNLSTIVLQAPPNDGVLSTVAPLPVYTSDLVGFDIINSIDAFAVLSYGEFETPLLFSLDIIDWQNMAYLGVVGTDRLVLDIALNIGDFGAAPSPGPGSGADVITGLTMDDASSTRQTVPQLSGTLPTPLQGPESVAPATMPPVLLATPERVATRADVDQVFALDVDLVLA